MGLSQKCSSSAPLVCYFETAPYFLVGREICNSYLRIFRHILNERKINLCNRDDRMEGVANMDENCAQQIWQMLQVCIAGLLNISPEEVSPEMSLMEDLGIDSLDLIELAVLVKKEFQVHIPIQSWMKEISSMAKELTSENLLEKINQLTTSTGLEFPPASLAVLRKGLGETASGFDQARTVVAMIKVETIHKLLLGRMMLTEGVAHGGKILLPVCEDREIECVDREIVCDGSGRKPQVLGER